MALRAPFSAKDASLERSRQVRVTPDLSFLGSALLAHRGTLFALPRSRAFGYTREIFGPKKAVFYLIRARKFESTKIWQDFSRSKFSTS